MPVDGSGQGTLGLHNDIVIDTHAAYVVDVSSSKPNGEKIERGLYTLPSPLKHEKMARFDVVKAARCHKNVLLRKALSGTACDARI